MAQRLAISVGALLENGAALPKAAVEKFLLQRTWAHFFGDALLENGAALQKAAVGKFLLQRTGVRFFGPCCKCLQNAKFCPGHPLEVDVPFCPFEYNWVDLNAYDI